MPIRIFSGRKRPKPSKVVRPSRARDEALQRQMAAAFTVSWAKGISRLRQNVNSDVLANAYMSGDYRSIIKNIPFTKTADYIADAIDDLRNSSGKGALNAAKSLPNSADLRYDLRNPAIEKYVTERQGFLIQGVNDEFHLTLQNLVKSRFATGTSTVGIQMGLLDEKTRRGVAGFVLKNSIGLDDRSAQALANYKASGKYTRKQAAAYESELHVRRAKLIAQTETAFAINEGQRAVWDAAADQGLIDRDVARKVWVVDGRPCPLCIALDGVSVLLDEQFLSPDGVRVPGPPLHPRCQCVMQLDVEGDDDNVPGSRQHRGEEAESNDEAEE